MYLLFLPLAPLQLHVMQKQDAHCPSAALFSHLHTDTKYKIKHKTLMEDYNLFQFIMKLYTTV